MASPAYCWDEETPQNDRTRTRPNRLVASLWGHHSGDGQEAWQESMQGTGLPGTPKFLQLILQKVFGLALGLRSFCVLKRTLFETNVYTPSFSRLDA
jgi:hypothetical protein